MKCVKCKTGVVALDLDQFGPRLVCLNCSAEHKLDGTLYRTYGREVPLDARHKHFPALLKTGPDQAAIRHLRAIGRAER